MVKALPYGALLKRAWQWTWKNKYLWVLGFFIATGGLLLQYDQRDWRYFKMFAAGDASWSNAAAFFDSWTAVFSFTFIILLMITLGLLSLVCAAGMLSAARDSFSADKNPAKLGALLAFGWKKLGRLLWLEILLNVPNLILLAPIFVYYSWPSRVHEAVMVAPLVLLILYNVWLFLIRHFYYCRAVLEDEAAWMALRQGTRFWRDRFKVLFLAKLVEVVWWFAVGIIAGMAVVLLLIPLGFLSLVLIFTFGMFMLWPMLILAAGVLVTFLLVFKGAVNTFLYAYLTQVYFSAK